MLVIKKKLFSFLLILSVSFSSWANTCHFKKDFELSILSGPLASLLREMSLLDSPQVKFISDLFLSQSEKQRQDLKDKLVRGGLFLSVKTMKKMIGTHTLFDKSQELSKQLKRVGVLNRVELGTRGLKPLEAALKSLDVLKPYLNSKCMDKIRLIKKRWSYQSQRAQKINWNKRKVIFFLGSVKPRKLPQTMILNDGFVKTLKNLGKIVTYPSRLDYTTWSQKILEQFIDDKTLLIGINTINEQDFRSRIYKNNKVDLWSFGVLTPGVGQLKFLESLANWQETLKI